MCESRWKRIVKPHASLPTPRSWEKMCQDFIILWQTGLINHANRSFRVLKRRFESPGDLLSVQVGCISLLFILSAFSFTCLILEPFKQKLEKRNNLLIYLPVRYLTTSVRQHKIIWRRIINWQRCIKKRPCPNFRIFCQNVTGRTDESKGKRQSG
jgi:hypothetical protein